MNEVGDNEVEVNKGVFGNVVNDQDIEKSFKVNEECINEDSSDGKGRENDHNNEGDTRLKNVQNKEQSVPEVSPKIGNSSSARGNSWNKSFTDALNKDIAQYDRSLEVITTEFDKDGIEVVVFDDVMVAEGSKRWELSICGFFVGFKMSVNALRYNLRRMWGRYGFKDILDYNNGVYFIKFHHEEGIDQVVNKGPWMVRNKPLIVQKWSVNMKLDKTDPDKIPLWVKLCDVPLEAWTVKGISALASRLGKSLVMDSVTTKMCKQGNGKVGYVRVLVEVSAKKELTDVTEVVYKNSMGEVHCRKSVKVVYGWKPPTCCDCGVFGHMLRNCHKKEPSKTNVQKENEMRDKSGEKGSDNGKKQWSVHRDIVDAMKRSANKFYVFGMYEINKQNELNELTNMEIMDVFLNKKVNPTKEEMKDWNLDMIAYYKQKRELLVLGTWNIRGLGTSEKQDEVKNFISEEKLQFLIGDMNVTLGANEHSMGGSYMTSDLKDFKDCVNDVEVEDINSSGLFFT
ncbi:zinc knuckle CX2CX4HX4C containing protein [Tanacetum coccineum]